ncbi:mitochondrial ribosomal protein MRP51 [Diplogelasinospora grovesii]|uniref:Mitochondrial ribosomal protein MRP51 n=1 Tax=Diplogelasinospora grovesii TaxID=303347 RepID=A0AAN6S475_9PEZI|nr:mitochondrial ribosomal protein MRP51 [Diplogelasinospora grovesii]
MAAARSVSPGGALLRASRLFSLPAPIPPPLGDITSSAYNSESSTQPFPTHQVITTLSSSRKRGDWGLKRPLPLKTTTKSSTPMLRVKQIDSIEQITDYSSAADHGLTLKKFQELRLPITAPTKNQNGGYGADRMNLPKRSVFEEDSDFTAVDPEQQGAVKDKRWKFNGPWLAGMTQGDFKKWLAKNVRTRRLEFRQFLKKKLAVEMLRPATQKALDNGEELPSAIDPETISEEQLTEYLRRLRQNNQELYDMVGQFLDLAPLQPPTMSDVRLGLLGGAKADLRTTENPYADSGPPVTHPSAGISYLRTAAYLDNHPIYGPQRNHPPQQARVVRPRRQAIDGKLGVAGFVVETPHGDNYSNNKYNYNPELDRLDPGVEGGAKLWVQPQRASVDSTGRVQVVVGNAKSEDELVVKELLGEEKMFGEVPKPVEEAPPRGGYRARAFGAAQLREQYKNGPKISSAQEYGLGTISHSSR